MGRIFRKATEEDAEEVLRVIAGAYRSIKELNIEFRAVNADLVMVQENIRDHTCYLYIVDGVVAATLSLKSLPEVTKYPFLYWFAVDPAFSGKGVGTQLLRYVEETIVRDTLLEPAVTLATSAKHPWLLPMYERNGYVRFFERDLGKDDKLVFLAKPLSPVKDVIPT